MKKTLVALAAVAATSAFAQSNITLYGLFDVNYGTTTTKSGTGAELRKTTGLGEGATAGNRIGFRGTEDMGGGLKASFVVETAFSPTTTDVLGNRAAVSGHNDTGLAAAAGNANTGNSAFIYSGGGVAGTTNTGSTNRQSYVGVSGGFGEVRVGYQYTNLYTVSSLSGYLNGYEGVAGADTLHTYGNANVGGTRANGVTYISPKFAGGFDVHVQYGSNANPAMESVTANGKAGTKRTGLLLNYANGPLKASLAYTTAKNSVAGTPAVAANTTYTLNASTGVISGNAAAAAVPASSTTGKLTQLAARYDFGVAAVQGTYNNGTNGAAAATDVKAYQVGVTVPFGAAGFFAAIGKGETEAGGVVTSEIKQRQIGATYTLSKRTMLYAVNGETKDTKVLGAAAAAKGTATRVGIRHTF